MSGPFPNSAASRIAAAHRADPSATARELADRLGIKLRTVRSAALQRALKLPKAPRQGPAFRKIGYAGRERGW